MLLILRNAEGMQHFGVGKFVSVVQNFCTDLGFGIWVLGCSCFSLKKFAIYSLHGAPSVILWAPLSSSQVPCEFHSSESHCFHSTVSPQEDVYVWVGILILHGLPSSPKDC